MKLLSNIKNLDLFIMLKNYLNFLHGFWRSLIATCNQGFKGKLFVEELKIKSAS